MCLTEINIADKYLNHSRTSTWISLNFSSTYNIAFFLKFHVICWNYHPLRSSRQKHNKYSLVSKFPSLCHSPLLITTQAPSNLSFESMLTIFLLTFITHTIIIGPSVIVTLKWSSYFFTSLLFGLCCFLPSEIFWRHRLFTGTHQGKSFDKFAPVIRQRFKAFSLVHKALNDSDNDLVWNPDYLLII